MSAAIKYLAEYMSCVELMLQRHMRWYADRLVDMQGQSYTDLHIGRSEMQRLLKIEREDSSQGWLNMLNVPSLEALEQAIVSQHTAIEEALRDYARSAQEVKLPLEELRARFDLDNRELWLLVAAAMPRLSNDHARLFSFVWADFSIKQPTASFLAEVVASQKSEIRDVLACLAPNAPLVRYRLVVLHNNERWLPDTPPAHAAVGVPRRVLDYLQGKDLEAAGLPGCVLHARSDPASLILDSTLAVEVQEVLRNPRARLILTGPAGSGRRTLLCALSPFGRVLEVDLTQAFAGVDERDEEAFRTTLAELMREALLHDSLLLLRVDDLWDSSRAGLFKRNLEGVRVALARYPGALVVAAIERDPQTLRIVPEARELRVALPPRAGQAQLWRRGLTDKVPDAQQQERWAQTLSRNYRLTPRAINKALQEAIEQARARGMASRERRRAGGGPAPGLSLEALLEAVRRQIDHRLGWLAEPYSVDLALDEVVLTESAREKIEQVLRYARNADQVFQHWGFERYSPQGRGLSVMFSGPPGTGKTLVAGVLARELGRILYRVDLSRIVDKYIGETEKNLGRVFDEAKRAQAILLFDEADSLFAKRTAVKSSNDRYANLEVNFLLQKLEAFEGVSILTTNFVTSIDEAFQRRIRFKIEFPMPDEDLRASLWQRLIPLSAPLSEDIDYERLGESFELSGGHIRNAILRAAMEAADRKCPLTEDLLWDAGVEECREMGVLIAGYEFED